MNSRAARRLGFAGRSLRALIRRCIASLDDSTGDTAVGVVVVWNSLAAAPKSILGAAVLSPGLNLRFAGALNHGRSRIDAAFIWVIQDDLTVRSGCFAALMARLAEDGAGT